MQPKRLITIATMWIVLVCALGNMCFGQTYWQRTYKGTVWGYPVTFLQTKDNYFLLGGSSYRNNVAGKTDFLIDRIKPNGDILWTKTFGDTERDVLSSIVNIVDGNFLVAGISSSQPDVGVEVNLLIKINPDGDSIWAKKVKFGSHYGFIGVIFPDADGNFLIGGKDGSAIMSSLVILKINSNGDTLWTRTNVGGSAGRQIDVQMLSPTSDGNFIVGVKIYIQGGINWMRLIKMTPDGVVIWQKDFSTGLSILPIQNRDFLVVQNPPSIIKIASNGDTLLMKTIEGTEMHSLQTIIPISNDNFLIGGPADPDSNGYSELCFMKINSNGDTVWTKTFSGKNKGYYASMIIVPTPDTDFLIGATVKSSNSKDQDIRLLKIRPTGDTLWTKTFGGKNNQILDTILKTADGNFLLKGSTENSDSTDGYPWLICIIADQYAKKNLPFNYKIPTYGADTLKFTYSPLKIPSGMTVSAGGTISWTPQTDSVYMDHAEFLVMNDAGRNDTLTFNIFVNSDYHTPVPARPLQGNKTVPKQFKINTTSLSGKVKFSLPTLETFLFIYDINGRIVDKVTPIASGSEAYVVWPGTSAMCSKIPTGKYFAKVSAGKNSAVKPFLLVR